MLAVAPAATVALPVENNLTIVNFSQQSANMTVNLEIDPELEPGAMLVIRNSSDGTARSLTPSTGFTSVAISGVINKSKVSTFVYDGSTFLNISERQVD